MTSSSLLLGNAKYDRIGQDNLLTKLGSGISSSTNDNYTELGMSFLTKDITVALDLFSNVILTPTFPADEIKQEIEQTLNYNNPYKMEIRKHG